MRIAVTGVSGFIGHALCRRLETAGHKVVEFSRSSERPGDVFFDESVDESVLTSALQGIDAVVHLAGVAHQEIDGNEAARQRYLVVNVELSKKLMSAAITANVSKFVYLSSAKAVGERSPIDSTGKPMAVSVDTKAEPEDIYGLSKKMAEQQLLECAIETDIDLVILRPPLVYGVGQKGNMARLFALVSKKLPLPLGGVTNSRSLISVDNLTHAIETVLTAERCANSIYFLADTVVSTSRLINLIGDALGVKVKLFSCPPLVLELFAKVSGHYPGYQKIAGSFIVDDKPFRRDFSWEPTVPIESVLSDIAVSLSD